MAPKPEQAKTGHLLAATGETCMASACLVGVNCRYDGGSKTTPFIRDRFLSGKIIPFCPELLGGMDVPRPRMLIAGGQGADVLDGAAAVKTESGKDRTAEMLRGARLTLSMAEALQPGTIYLKTGSPSCGWGMHKGKEVVGVTAALLSRNNFILSGVE